MTLTADGKRLGAHSGAVPPQTPTAAPVSPPVPTPARSPAAAGRAPEGLPDNHQAVLSRDHARRECERLADDQEGVISRGQALSVGMTDGHLAREVSGRRWQRSDHDGVYLVHTGPISYLARCWAALLHAGAGAALGMETAAWIWGILDDPPSTVHVAVPADRRPAAQEGVSFHVRVHLSRRVHPAKTPAVVRLEETLLDMVDRRGTSAEQVIGWVLRACQRRLTTEARLRLALAGRSKIRHRRLLRELLSEVRAGVQTPLERGYLRDVERAHGLPRGERNRSEGGAGARRYRDVRYRGFLLVVELDGRVFHPPDEREQDNLRDADLLAREGTRTVRYGWRAVRVTPCRTAEQVAALLRQAGAEVTARRCGPHCTVTEAG